jgi:hypothetical protein
MKKILDLLLFVETEFHLAHERMMSIFQMMLNTYQQESLEF